MVYLSVNNVSKNYGSLQALDDVNIQIPAGEIFGLVGPNGAGKSTIIRLIMNIIWPDKGSILIRDEPISLFANENCGYLPEERGLYKKMKVKDILTFFACLKGADKNTVLDKVSYWLNRFEMLATLDKNCEELSKGMSQKIQFIGTILHDPTLLILDEPFSGLDPVGMELLIDVILELRSKGKTIIFSSHQMEQGAQSNNLAWVNF